MRAGFPAANHVSGSHLENRSIVQRLIARPEFGPFVLLIVEIAVFWSFNHNFLSPQNISNTLAFTVELGLIALAMTLLDDVGRIRPVRRFACSASRRC